MGSGKGDTAVALAIMLAALTVGGGLIWLAVWLFGDFEPSCEPSETVIACREYINGTYVGNATVEDQRADYNRDTFVFVLLPGILFVGFGLWAAYTIIRDRWPNQS